MKLRRPMLPYLSTCDRPTVSLMLTEPSLSLGTDLAGHLWCHDGELCGCPQTRACRVSTDQALQFFRLIEVVSFQCRLMGCLTRKKALQLVWLISRPLSYFKGSLQDRKVFAQRADYLRWLQRLCFCTHSKLV